MKNVQLSSPWESVHHMLEAFFKEDPEITVSKIDYSRMLLTIYVANVDKYLALKKILKTSYVYPKVTLEIDLVCNVDATQIKYNTPGAKKSSTYNFDDEDSISLIIDGYDSLDADDEPIYILQTALTGNDIFDKIEIVEMDDVYFYFCIFKKKVIQYFNDVLSDPNGNESTLAQNIAPQIFDIKSPIMYCTETTDIN